MKNRETKNRLYPKTLGVVKGLQIVNIIMMLVALLLWQQTNWLPVVIYLLSVNVIVILLFWFDKKRAIKNQQRVSEKSLITVGLLGLHVGTVFARRWLKHKTVSLSFNSKVLLSQYVLLALVGGSYWFVLNITSIFA